MDRRARRTGAVLAALVALVCSCASASVAAAQAEQQDTTSVDFESEGLPDGVELISDRSASAHPSDLARSGRHVLRLDCERSCVGTHPLLSFDEAHHSVSLHVGYSGDLGVDLTISLTALTDDGLDVDRDSATFAAGTSLEALRLLQLSTDDGDAAIRHLQLIIEIEDPVADDPDAEDPGDADPGDRDPEDSDPGGNDRTGADDGGVDLTRSRSDDDPAGRLEFTQDRRSPLPGAILFDDLVIVRMQDQPPGPSDTTDPTTDTSLTAESPSTQSTSDLAEDNRPWLVLLLVLVLVLVMAVVFGSRRLRKRTRPDRAVPQNVRVEPRWDDGEAHVRETVRPRVEITGRLDPREGSTMISDGGGRRSVP